MCGGEGEQEKTCRKKKKKNMQLGAGIPEGITPPEAAEMTQKAGTGNPSPILNICPILRACLETSPEH